MKPKLIFLTGVYDTLDIFIMELIRAFERMGYDILQIDTKHLMDGLSKLSAFINTPVKAAITFNNLAFNLELAAGRNIWEDLKIPCINILMDHPFCYYDALQSAPYNGVVLCIDKKHTDYLQRFFPNIAITGFLAHGGKDLEKKPLPIRERQIDILYAGGLSKAFVQNVMPDFDSFDFDAQKIAELAYQRLIADVSLTAEQAIEEELVKHEIQMPDAELSAVISKLHYVELLATSYYREQVIRVLVEHGFCVHLYGRGWETCDFINKPNLIWEGVVSAQEVLEQMHNSKIVLNTMTWFKDGTHDRVLNGMLAGAVAVTDESIYMKENFVDAREKAEDAELVLFHLNKMDELVKRMDQLLANPDLMQELADRGRKKAMSQHTWGCRAKELQQDLFPML